MIYQQIDGFALFYRLICGELLLKVERVPLRLLSRECVEGHGWSLIALVFPLPRLLHLLIDSYVALINLTGRVDLSGLRHSVDLSIMTFVTIGNLATFWLFASVVTL